MMWWIVNNLIVYHLNRELNRKNENRVWLLIFFVFITFGRANLNTTTAPETTNDKSPSVKAFHAFNAIKAKANGNKTVVLNFNPSKNGIKTFFTRPRPFTMKTEVKYY